MTDMHKFANNYIEKIPRIIMVTFIFASCSCFLEDGKNVENFRFDIFLAISQEPQDIMEILIKYLDSLTDFTTFARNFSTVIFCYCHTRNFAFFGRKRH